jgi:hypothetical protein
MSKRLFLVSVTIVIFLTSLYLSPTASAELTAGVQLGYGATTYSEILGDKSLKATEWSDRLWVNLAKDDLLFTLLYQGAHSLKGQGVNRTVAQVGANYLFLNEAALQVYGGLGYQFLNARVENANVEDAQKSTFTGHGFVGQVVLAIPVSEQVRTTATITGNPWMKWSFNQGDVTDHNLKMAPSFVYQLDLTYDFSEDLGAHLGLLGGSFKVPEFTFSGKAKGATKASFTGISLGVTHRF